MESNNMPDSFSLLSKEELQSNYSVFCKIDTPLSEVEEKEIKDAIDFIPSCNSLLSEQLEEKIKALADSWKYNPVLLELKHKYESKYYKDSYLLKLELMDALELDAFEYLWFKKVMKFGAPEELANWLRPIIALGVLHYETKKAPDVKLRRFTEYSLLSSKLMVEYIFWPLLDWSLKANFIDIWKSIVSNSMSKESDCGFRLYINTIDEGIKLKNFNNPLQIWKTLDQIKTKDNFMQHRIKNLLIGAAAESMFHVTKFYFEKKYTMDRQSEEGDQTNKVLFKIKCYLTRVASMNCNIDNVFHTYFSPLPSCCVTSSVFRTFLCVTFLNQPEQGYYESLFFCQNVGKNWIKACDPGEVLNHDMKNVSPFPYIGRHRLIDSSTLQKKLEE